MRKNGEFVGVDEKFIPENEKYVEDPIIGNDEIKNGYNKVKSYVTNEENQEKFKKSGKKALKIGKGIGIGYLCFLGVIFALVIGIIIFSFTTFNNIRKTQNDMMSSIQQKQDEITSSVQQKQDEITSSVQQKQDEITSSVQQQQNEVEKQSFNNKFELYSGTSSKLFVTTLLDNIVTNNKKNSDKVITVVYNEKTTTDANEIVELKSSFEQGKDYEVMLDYDTNGLVNKVTIKDIK